MQSQMHKCMNSKYRNKSEIYHDAAVELIKGDYLFSPIPHIAYYSCLLLMSHIWFVEKQHSITELQTKDNGEYTNKVHVILANKIKELVIENFKKTDVTIGDEFGKKLAKARLIENFYWRLTKYYNDLASEYQANVLELNKFKDKAHQKSFNCFKHVNSLVEKTKEQ